MLGTVDLQMFRVVGGLASVDTGEPDGAEAGTVPVGEELREQVLRRGAHVHPQPLSHVHHHGACLGVSRGPGYGTSPRRKCFLTPVTSWQGWWGAGESRGHFWIRTHTKGLAWTLPPSAGHSPGPALSPPPGTLILASPRPVGGPSSSCRHCCPLSCPPHDSNHWLQASAPCIRFSTSDFLQVSILHFRIRTGCQSLSPHV